MPRRITPHTSPGDYQALIRLQTAELEQLPLETSPLFFRRAGGQAGAGNPSAGAPIGWRGGSREAGVRVSCQLSGCSC